MAESTCSVEGCVATARKRGMCSKHYQAWRKANLEECRPKFAGMKCQVDGCDAPAGRRSGLCQPCYVRRWESENVDRVRARRADDADRIRDMARERSRRYRMESPERFREADQRFRERNPEMRKASQERYRKSPRGIVKNRQKGARRRARMRDAFVETVDYAAVIAEHGMFCHICSLVIVDESDLHFDHVIPLAAGGLHEARNVRPAHAVCNLKKGPRVA